ncbi:MAG: hypothetical protein KDA96_19330, partial [Planctomycetaceae bacterium]|nr:hypothetical protein [Planctomycetaceae bacterium]
AMVVAPLVFAGAPIINTFASMTVFNHGAKLERPGLMFYVGLVMAAAGMALVMLNKPKPASAAAPPAAESTPASDSATH